MDNLELWYRANRGKSANGVPPISFKSNGDALTNWTIYGYTSPNLFDASSIVPDSSIDFQTGEIVESDGTSVSNWIPISDTGLFFSGMLTSSDPSASLVIFALYDGEKNLLDIQATGWNESGAKSHEITVVEGTAFLRLQLTDNIYQDVMMNQGSSALPYEAFGAVGERTENLFDKKTANQGYYLNANGAPSRHSNWSYSDFINITPNTSYLLVNFSSVAAGTVYHWFYDSNKDAISGAKTTSIPDLTVESPDNAVFLRICVRLTEIDDCMLVKGETAPIEYVPYGYKIPVICGGVTTNIYIGNTPLGTGQTVTGSETGVAIPTIAGQNTFSVNTTMQPPKVTVSAAKGMTESLMKYLEFKYGVLKMAGVQTGIFEISGTSPLSFTANGEPLRDWVIYGADGGVGDKTENEYNIYTKSETVYHNGVTFTVDRKTGTVTANGTATGGNALFTFNLPSELYGNMYFKGCPSGGGISGRYNIYVWDATTEARPKQHDGNTTALNDSGNGIYKEVKWIQSHANIMTIRIYNNYTANNLVFKPVLSFTTPDDFEPYGYKIPITCNNETSILYLNEPLESGDSISFSDTGVEVHTIEGRNTLTVDTEVQPSEIKIKFKQ